MSFNQDLSFLFIYIVTCNIFRTKCPLTPHFSAFVAQLNGQKTHMSPLSPHSPYPYSSYPFYPIHVIDNMLNFIPAPTHPTGPSFMVLSNFGRQTLTHGTLIKQFRLLLALIGHNVQGFSGHRIRSGGASFALACVVLGELIMLQGDWIFDSYHRCLDRYVFQNITVVTIMMTQSCLRVHLLNNNCILGFGGVKLSLQMQTYLGK